MTTASIRTFCGPEHSHRRLFPSALVTMHATIPIPRGHQGVAMEKDEGGIVHTVHMLTDYGRIAVNVYATSTSRTWDTENGESTQEFIVDQGFTEITVRESDAGLEYWGSVPGGEMVCVLIDDGPTWAVRLTLHAHDREHMDVLYHLGCVLLEEITVDRGAGAQPAFKPLDLSIIDPADQDPRPEDILHRKVIFKQRSPLRCEHKGVIDRNMHPLWIETSDDESREKIVNLLGVEQPQADRSGDEGNSNDER